MVIDKVALTLAVIGALNWGSIGLFGFDLADLPHHSACWR